MPSLAEAGGDFFPIYVLRLFRAPRVSTFSHPATQLTINILFRQFTPEQETYAWLVTRIEVQLSYVALKINTYRHLWMRLVRKIGGEGYRLLVKKNALNILIF